MRTYYRGPDVTVTSELFARRSSPTKLYAIRELRNVCLICDRDSGRHRPLIAAALGFLGLVAAVAALAADRPYAVLLLLLATLLAVPGTLLWPRRPGDWELRAAYRGRTEILYRSRDVTVFHQVARALRRAIEADRRPAVFEADDAA